MTETTLRMVIPPHEETKHHLRVSKSMSLLSIRKLVGSKTIALFLTLAANPFLLTTQSKTKVNLRSLTKEVMEPEALNLMRCMVITTRRTAITTRDMTRQARRLGRKRE